MNRTQLTEALGVITEDLNQQGRYGFAVVKLVSPASKLDAITAHFYQLGFDEVWFQDICGGDVSRDEGLYKWVIRFNGGPVRTIVEAALADLSCDHVE